jgi:hypothetical protein
MSLRISTLLALIACGAPQTEAVPPPPAPGPTSEAPPAEAPPAETAPAETPATAPAETPTPVAKTCTTSADCAKGEMCQGPEGCGTPWTCGPQKPCTRDLVTYCGCDGQTFKGSGSCPARPYASRGACGK